jgi:hypothetical protein
MDTLSLSSGPHNSGGSSERDRFRRADHRRDVMSSSFLAGILLGLTIGGLVGTMAAAFVAAGAEKRSHRTSSSKRLPTG